MAKEPEVAPAGEGGFEGLIAGGGPVLLELAGLSYQQWEMQIRSRGSQLLRKNNFGKQPHKSEIRSFYFIFDRF